MQGKRNKLVAFMVSASLLVSLAACGGNDKDTASGNTNGSSAVSASDEKKNEPVTISLFMRQAGDQTEKVGEQTDPVAKEIEKKLGIKISIYKDGNGSSFKETLATMLASNDLADIMTLDEEKDLQACIKADNITPLDDLLKDNAPNIMNTPDLKLRMDYNRKKYGVDGKVYNVSQWLGTGVDVTPVGGPYIRWDLYKKLGYPAINNEDDMIKVLSDMQKLEPKTKSGQKVYAVAGFFADSPTWGDWNIGHTFAWNRGYVNNSYLQMIDISTNKMIPNPLTDPDSIYWQNVSFYYKAMKAGLVDPDSMTQKYDKYLEKAKAGRYLLVSTGWDARGLKNDLAAAGNTEAAFICLPGYKNDPGAVLGWTGYVKGRFLVISKACKNPGKALQLLDYFASPEGTRLLHSGVENLSWKMVDGKPTWTEEYLNDRKTMDKANLREKYGAGKYQGASGYQLNVISPKDGEMFDLDQSMSFLEKTYNETEKDAIKYYGAKDIRDIYLKDKKAFVNVCEYGSMPDKPAEIKTIEANLNNYVYTNIFKCILAKNDEDYKAKKKTFIDGLAKYKVDELYKWLEDAYNKNKQELEPEIGPLVKEFSDKVLGN